MKQERADDEKLSWLQRRAVKIALKKVKRQHKKFKDDNSEEMKKRLIGCILEASEVLDIQIDDIEITKESLEKEDISELKCLFEEIINEMEKTI